MPDVIDVLVTGSTGTTGSRVASILAHRGIAHRRASRSARRADHVRFDWTDSATHRDALRGVSAVYLIAPIGVVDPVPLVEPFLEEALRQGVRRVVQLSSSALPEGAPGLGAVHQLVRARMPEWAVLRPSWFMQNFTGDHAVAHGVRSGEIVTATRDGRVAFVDAGDIAAVAVHALTADNAHNDEYILTGPEALSYHDAAAIIAQQTGKEIRHRCVSASEYAEIIAAQGIPLEFAHMLAALDTAIAHGSEDRVTDTVERVTGRPARSFREFVALEI